MLLILKAVRRDNIIKEWTSSLRLFSILLNVRFGEFYLRIKVRVFVAESPA